jgi:hypothetical protein
MLRQRRNEAENGAYVSPDDAVEKVGEMTLSSGILTQLGSTVPCYIIKICQTDPGLGLSCFLRFSIRLSISHSALHTTIV